MGDGEHARPDEIKTVPVLGVCTDNGAHVGKVGQRNPFIETLRPFNLGRGEVCAIHKSEKDAKSLFRDFEGVVQVCDVLPARQGVD